MEMERVNFNDKGGPYETEEFSKKETDPQDESRRN